MVRNGEIERVLRIVRFSARKRLQPYVVPLETAKSSRDLRELSHVYTEMNYQEKANRTPAICAKATLLAETIRALASIRSLPAIRNTLKRIQLHPSSRDIVVALISNGTVTDLVYVVKRICDSVGTIYYVNHIEICDILTSRLKKLPEHIPECLSLFLRLRNFWEYMNARERRSAAPDTVLPLRNFENRPPLIRIVAHAVIGLSRPGDEETLRSLVNHSYTAIARAAASRLSELQGEAALSAVANEIDAAIESGRGAALAEAIRLTERGLYGQQLWI
jgi:hypothetical protein